MLKKILIATVVLGLILTIGVGVMGCGKSLQESSPNYFPHNNGYSWEYSCKMTVGTSESTWTKTNYFDGADTLLDGRIVQKFMVSEEAASTGVKCFGFADTSGYYEIEDSGVYYYGSVSNPTTEATLILPFPLEVGSTWQRGILGTFEVLGIETVEVPAGSFQAVKVGQPEDESYEWYADGVGMVKSSISALGTRLENGRIVAEEGIFTDELVSRNF